MHARAVEGEGNERRRVISFSSEEPYFRSFGAEILSHAESDVRLQRANEIGVLLFNHNYDRVVGKLLRCWIEESRGCAEVEFDTDADAEVIFGKVKSETLKGVSVGYIVYDWEYVKAGAKSKDGRFDGDCWIARDWEVLEISIVSVPADAGVGVGRSMEQTDAPFIRSHCEHMIIILQLGGNRN